MKSVVARLSICFLILTLPIAVAGQNIGTGLVSLMLFAQIWQRRGTLPERVRQLWTEHRWTWLASLSFLAAVLLGGLLNPKQLHPIGFLPGYIAWLLLPPVVYLAQDDWTKSDWRFVCKCLAVAALVMGAVALAQSVWGFKLEGVRFVSTVTRAQGFYSHPLTFAYVVLLILPLGCAMVARSPRDACGWALLVGSLLAVYASASRTVQAVSSGIILFNILRFASGRVRAVMLVLAIMSGIAVWTTDNPVSQKFKLTLAGRWDVNGPYADDRLAFWHVAWTMVTERPLLGHGEALDTSYRTPYYEGLGLAAFTRKYEAHNMFLQVAVNAGFVGLGAFVSWLALLVRRSWHLAHDPQRRFGGLIAIQTIAAFCIAALTQNAFQDSEVRFALTLFTIALWMAGPCRAPGPGFGLDLERSPLKKSHC